ncbi:MAG: C25 family cysteine peptidase, partial [Candidatus Thermoplasmatota archaeon]
LRKTGYPILPVNITIFNFKLGTTIKNINADISEPIIINLTEPLRYNPLITTDNVINKKQEAAEIPNIYPNEWFTIQTGGGLIRENRTSFFILRIYPVRYKPDTHQLLYTPRFTINITFQEPEKPVKGANKTYDLLVISPAIFISTLKPLIQHKEEIGIKTKNITLQRIYKEIDQGRDNAEKIKYYIKHAIEEWGIRYVLLVGGRRYQSYSWHLPVRYSHVVPYDIQEYNEISFLSDLYYADIYNYEGTFSSWDTNMNGVFSEWTNNTRDEIDLYPDVYLGRLACNNKNDLRIIVNKIINYEKQKANDSWFKRMVMIAGDSYDDESHYIEGELATDEAYKYMSSFTPVRVWASEQDINRDTVKAAVDPGCGFIYICGHGNPANWNTHYPPNGTIWCTGFGNKDIRSLRNNDKLPIIIVGGCHNAQFDTTMINLIVGILKHRLKYFSTKQPYGEFWHREWVPRCWAWQFMINSKGGGIATIANTGLGTHGSDDVDHNRVPDYLEVLDGWLEINFFRLYGEGNMDILGQIHGDTLSSYLNIFLGNNDPMDVKMVQQWVLLGDPSLKIGGYS